MRHTATFSGHPLGTGVIPTALATIEQHAADGERIAAAMAAGLAEIREQHGDVVVETRGRGLLWGIDFTTAEVSGNVLAGLAQSGLVVSPCISRPTTVRLLPPIVATDEDVKEALSLLSGAIAQAAASS